MNTQPYQPAQILQHFHLFEPCTPDELGFLAREASDRRLRRGEMVYEEGESSDTVGFLVKGNLKRARISEQGREVIKEVLNPVSMFGELCLAGEKKRREFVQVISETARVIIIPRKDLYRLMHANQKWALHLMQWLALRLHRTETRLESMITKDARDRIIDFIKDSARRQGRRVGYETLIRHSLTQQDIANMTGTSRQTVTSVMNELKRNNLIYFNRKTILVRDLEQLS